jgi:alkanesulfonate monooxygenase SsuD/methylene tetrahydromethanopterin reductase-like flavin-dependent oxidoreductase (luciferase family)
MSERTGRMCDGIITVGAADEKIKMLMEKFEEGARQEDKDPSEMPRMIQLHVSYAGSQEEAEEQAVREWPNGGMPFPKADIRNPEDFAAMANQVTVENFKNRVLMSADPDEHLEHIQHYVDLGFDEIYVHNVGRNQKEFIQTYGERVIPKLRWPEE